MRNDEAIRPQDMVGIYGELAELIGADSVEKIYDRFKGQQVAFPMRLYTKEYIMSQVKKNRNESIKKLATEFGYSERRLRQIMNEGAPKE